MVFASAIAAAAVTRGIAAVYFPAAAVLALGMPDAVAGEPPAVSAASSVQPPWCAAAAAAAELQASAAAARRAEVASAIVAELAGPPG